MISTSKCGCGKNNLWSQFTPRKFYVLLIIALLFCVYHIGIYVIELNTVIIISHHRPRSKTEEIEQKFVVDTPACKIPQLDPWDTSVIHFFRLEQKPVECTAKYRAWVYLEGTELVLNNTAIHESGYSTASIRCCYRVIERVEQPLNTFNSDADNIIKLSDNCYPLNQTRQEIFYDFVRVHCISTSPFLLENVVYRDFFAMAHSNLDRLISSKIFKYKNKNFTGRPMKPPNVVIVGIDNNSRLNSQRNLPKTLEFLSRIGAIELMGYTKVGENTFPNTVSFMTGYSEEELIPLCLNNTLDPQDDCPYIWQGYDQAGYLTLTAEDMPYVSGFNYMKTGFLRKPTDFYLRPFMLTVLAHTMRNTWFRAPCIGARIQEQVILNYILEAINISSSTNTPIFVHSWITALAHRNISELQFGDAYLLEFVKKLEETSDTIFFFMGDHGDRHGEFRETVQGWYEDKLPTQWVYIPPRLRQQFPDWYASLLHNGKRLTSHYDMYKTMLHILQTFDYEHQAEEFYRKSASQIGQSLFEPITDNRTCEDAGIPVNYCACTAPKTVDVSDDMVKNAVDAALLHLTNTLPKDVCAVPKLKEITNADFLNHPKTPIYVVSFVTEPGDFLFEATVEKEHNQFVVTTDLLRMNKISRPANCVRSPLLERYCYCK